MTTDEKISILAKAILELAGKAACTWDHGDEQTVSTGVDIDLQAALQQIADE